MATTLLRKTANVAVGIPVAATKSIIEKAKEFRTELMESGDKLSADMQKRFEEWVTEGEALVDSLMRAGEQNMDKVVDLRDRTETRAKQAADRVTETADTTATKAAETARAVVTNVTQPRIALTEINGIGPATAKKLAMAGVSTIAGLHERTETKKDTEALASQTGISVDQLTEWAEKADLTRITGVGPEMQTLLQAAEIGTIEALASMKVADLELRFSNLEAMGWDQVPSIDTAKGWVSQAKKLKS